MDRSKISALFLVLVLSTFSPGSPKRDPLTKAETEEMREIADQPNLRIKLIVKYSRARMAALEKSWSSVGSTPGSAGSHDLLEDFTSIVEELEDNLDMYDRQNADLRKSLKLIIEADTEFTLKLRARQSGTIKSKVASEEDESSMLQRALEALNDNISTAREILAKQSRDFAREKQRR